MSDLEQGQPAALARTAEKKSRRTKTDEELLAEAERRASSLRERIEAARDKRRLALVEDLYALHGVDPQPGDLGEANRISLLRSRLGI